VSILIFVIQINKLACIVSFHRNYQILYSVIFIRSVKTGQLLIW